jgi:predicted PurR-regulated permease PerM
MFIKLLVLFFLLKRSKMTLENKDFRRYVFWAIVLVLVVLAFMIVKPYLIALISAFILAYLVRPLYKKLEPRIGGNVSALFCIVLIILIVILPLGVIVGGVTQQALSAASNGGLDRFFEKVSSYAGTVGLKFNLDDLSEKGFSVFLSLFKSAAGYVPSLLISLVVTLFAVYYMLVDWEELIITLKDYLPFREKDEVSREISSATHALVYGTLLVGALEFIVSVAGFYASGVSTYLFLPMIIFFTAFIPGIGPAIVYVPLAIYMFAVGRYYSGAGVLVTGLIVGIFIDEFVRVKILGKKSKIHPLVMLVGLLGGIGVFGIFGFIIGPLILVYTLKLLEEGVGRQ